MAGSLLEIRKKIKAVKNTAKITKAMKLVAASKMKYFQKKAVASRDFSWSLLEVLHGNMGIEFTSSLNEKREEGKIMFILYTSDKGLCGALNSKLIRSLVSSDLWKNTPAEDRMLVTVGKKSNDYARFNSINVHKSFLGINEKMTAHDAIEFVDFVFEEWNKRSVKQVVMVAPHYKNSLVFYPRVKTYLPFSSEMVNEHIRLEEEEVLEQKSIFGDEPPIIYEPDAGRFFEVLMEQIVVTLFMQSFQELKASEYSSRMIAMQSATDAANDMIDKLSLTFNKVRQTAITQEIAELVGGSMA